jgi:hypothetical protein
MGIELLVHEVAVLGQYYEEDDKDKEHLLFRHFNYLEEVLTTRIEEICEAAGCDNEPTIYLSGKNNFRYDIATVKPYKGNRKNLEKPIHFENVKWFLISRYNAIIVDGMEADDALAIHQTAEVSEEKIVGLGIQTVHPTVICTRDKDLRQVPGWHYGWEVGLQPEYPLTFVDELGELNATYKESISKSTGLPTKSFKKLSGTGYLFFCSQILTGDSTDNIPGLKGCGPKKAYDLLSDAKDEGEAFRAVFNAYREVYDDEMESRRSLLEQARLVWMVREVNEDGNPVMWEIPNVS